MKLSYLIDMINMELVVSSNNCINKEVDNMVVGLYGIGGVYNFGCEAIVRGAYNFVKEIYPNCEIIYFSYNFDYDQKALSDLKLKICRIELKNSYSKRVINKVAKIFKVNHRCFMFDIGKIFDSVDVIVSIGGDIYTIPKVLRNNEKYPYYNPLVDFCDRAIKKGKDVIVYGASVGPWGRYKKAVDYYVKTLSKYKLILCREQETINYLNEVGLNNVMFFPDPAFQITVNKNEKGKKYIGINLSPLSLNEVYGSFDDYFATLAQLIDKVYENFNKEILFIPHVLSRVNNDNDLLFMEKIREHMKYQKYVTIADTSGGFIGIKRHIVQCHVVCAARMHCNINSICENIPTVFISYSQKSVGMCKYVYGNDSMVIDIQDVEKKLIDSIGDALKKENEIVEFLEKRNKEIKEYYDTNIYKVKNILNNKLDY